MATVDRLKWVIAKYGVPVAVVFAIVGVAALFGAWSVYSEPPTERITETVDEQQFVTEMETEAEVTGETVLYDQGTTLVDQPAYFYNATQAVTIRVRTSVPDDRNVDVEQRLVFRHVATRNDEVFWESAELLGDSSESVTDGESTLEVTVDMAEVRDFVNERRAAISGVGTVRSELNLEVTYETDTAADSLEPSTGVTLTQRAYWFDDALRAEQTHEESETREVTLPPDYNAVIGLSGIGVGALLLAVAFAALQRREFDIDRIETDIARARYDEWISRGEIPTKGEKQYIRIDTLEDLVDIAIDSQKRVIYERTYETYGVVDGEDIYYFTESDDDSFGAWLDI